MAEVQIFEDITATTLERVAAVVDGLSDGDELRLVVSSYGGDFCAALGIIGLLRSKEIKTHCDIIGIAASSAAVLALACDECYIDALGALMLHSCFRVRGERDEGVERLNAVQLAIIKKRAPNMTDDVLQHDTWFNPQEAQTFGLVDGIIEPRGGIHAATARYMALAGGSMEDLKKEQIEQIAQEEQDEQQEERAENVQADGEQEAQPDALDVLEKLAQQLVEIEKRLQALEEQRAQKVEARARLNKLVATLAAPQQSAPIGGGVQAQTVKRVDVKKYGSFIKG